MSALEHGNSSGEGIRIAPVEGKIVAAWPVVPHLSSQRVGLTEYGLPLRAEVGERA